jgi:hypothetical protein
MGFAAVATDEVNQFLRAMPIWRDWLSKEELVARKSSDTTRAGGIK